MLETFEKYWDDLARAEAWRSDRVSCIPHYHTGVEIVYVLEGRVSAIIGGRALTADAGQAIVSGSYTVHAYGEEKAPAIVAIIPPCETPALQKRLIAGRFVNPVFSDEDDRLKQMMQLLLSEQEDAVVRAGLSAAVLGFAMRKAGFETMAGDDKGGLMAQVLEQGESITFAYQAVKKRGNRLASFRVEGMSAVREFNYVFLDTPVSLQAVEYFDSFRPDGEGGERAGH